jgi:hypothetical protein
LYCGAVPPDVLLHVDHVVPVCEGGGNEPENLVTACQECNSGKGGIPIDVASEKITELQKRAIEAEEQAQELRRLQNARKRAHAKILKEIEDRFEQEFGLRFLEPFRASLRKNFLPRLDSDSLLMAADRACSKCHRLHLAQKYFCGMCWGMIREAA